MTHLGVSLPHEDGFSKVKTYSIKIVYYSIYDDNGVNTDGTWINWGWFYTTKYGVFGDREKCNLKDLHQKLLKRSVYLSGFTCIYI